MTELHIITLSDITDINVLSLKDGHFFYVRQNNPQSRRHH